MNVLYLKYAIEVAKTGSISKAAENLYIAQPNLSRAIKELESSLGITIFVRNSKGMTLTPDGEKLLRYSHNALYQLDRIESMFKNGQKKRQLFSASVPRVSYIAHAFAQFTKRLNKEQAAEIFYNETDSLSAINNVINNAYRLGIIRYADKYAAYYDSMFEENDLACSVISEFSYGLIMSKHSPLAALDKIFRRDLVKYTEIAHADPYVPSVSVKYVKKEELPEYIDKRIFVFERASQFAILNANPDTFMWVSKIPRGILDKLDLVQRKCEENDKLYKDVLIRKKDYKLTALDNMFIEQLYKAKNEIMDADYEGAI